MIKSVALVTVVSISLLTLACGHSRPRVTPFPHGDAIELFDGPVHLGDDLYDGQAFPAGPAVAARACSLVNIPRTIDVYIQVRDVRNTETLSNVLQVNDKKFPLPSTLERLPSGDTSNAMSASPVQRVQLEQGPTQVCLVSGHRMNGDLDDFEVAGATLFVEGLDAREIGVRRGLVQGQPAASAPPSVPWGERQAWPQQTSPAPASWRFPWASR